MLPEVVEISACAEMTKREYAGGRIGRRDDRILDRDGDVISQGWRQDGVPDA